LTLAAHKRLESLSDDLKIGLIMNERQIAWRVCGTGLFLAICFAILSNVVGQGLSPLAVFCAAIATIAFMAAVVLEIWKKD
jgi:hypothetical protein